MDSEDKSDLNHYKNEIRIYKEEIKQQIRDESIEWARKQLVIWKSVFIIIAAVIGFFGLTTYKDVVGMLTDIKNTEEDVGRIKSDVEKIADPGWIEQIKNFNAEFKQAEKNRKKVQELMEKAEKQITKIHKLSLGKIKIAVHYLNSDNKHRTEKYEEFKHLFNSNGYILYREDFLNISSNINEIIYYSPLLQEEAEQIKSLLEKDYSNIDIREGDDVLTANPNQILIKLRT